MLLRGALLGALLSVAYGVSAGDGSSVYLGLGIGSGDIKNSKESSATSVLVNLGYNQKFSDNYSFDVLLSGGGMLRDDLTDIDVTALSVPVNVHFSSSDKFDVYAGAGLTLYQHDYKESGNDSGLGWVAQAGMKYRFDTAFVGLRAQHLALDKVTANSVFVEAGFYF